MQVADSATVLGDFSGGSLVHFGDTTRMRREGGSWVMNATAADGTHRDFPVRYTFGVRPLQQYVTELPGGRFGVLPPAWDARPRAAGGQRWLDLRPGEPIRPGDELFWTHPSQIWNHQCAQCHTTGWRKDYQVRTDSFASGWSEIGVGCEACHGAGSAHVAQARAGTWRDSAFGLPVAFRQRTGVTYGWDRAGNRPVRSTAPPAFRAETETCAACHSRRATMWDGDPPGGPLLQTHRLTLLGAPFYFADGLIREEVYEYGSFLQSRMYAAGVTCSDCHEPHNLRLRADGNALCGSCHLAARYDAPSHTMHRAGTRGSACVDCHMPTRTYMQVDVRRDHSLQVPRPDLTVSAGSPNACQLCHAARGPEWAARAVARTFGPNRPPRVPSVEAFTLGNLGHPAAESLLMRVARSPAPAIVRATALEYLVRYQDPRSLEVVQEGLASPEPLVRLGALAALARMPALERLSFAVPLLRDSVRAVRLDAAATLAGIPAERLAPRERDALSDALAEYRASELRNGDQPWSWLNLGLIAAQQGDAAGADSAYRAALRRDTTFIPALVNLADLYREQGRDGDGEPLLQRARQLAPRSPDVRYALAMLLVRRQRYREAELELIAASFLAPNDRRIAQALEALQKRSK